MENISFEAALTAIKTGKFVRRKDWGEDYLQLLKKDIEWPMLQPFIALVKNSKIFPYMPSHEDMFSDDWIIIS